MKKKNLKHIAFYLPQFHEIPENNEWWGEGFTEWTNTESSKPLFEGHNQPRKPFRDNFYNLTNSETLKWQSQLMNEYGVYGMCFYHYWFKGKKLLEKPSEILLEHKDINMNFCFSWANETWSRTWNGTSRDVLIEQNYGGISDWLNHIEYLIPFFKDDRYIKVNGRPLFLIYNLSKIDRLQEILEVWNEVLKKDGISEIYLVETLNSYNFGVGSPLVDAQVEFEPWYSIAKDKKLRAKLKLKRFIRSFFGDYLEIPKVLHSTIDYSYIVKRAFNRKSNLNVYKGVFPDWDNSARKSQLKNATIITGASPDKFGKALKKASDLFHQGESGEFVFINAWNEWAEGAYLEPDALHEYGYIEQIKKNG